MAPSPMRFLMTLAAFDNVCEFECEDEHAHLLMDYSLKVDVLALTQRLKGASSGMVRKSSRAALYNMVPDLPCGS